jgi:antitoxin MazE
MTQAVISKWGNSLAVRLPKQIAEQLQLGEGQTVELVTNGGALELRPTRSRRYTRYDREELIAQIDPANNPESFDDRPVGKEAF